MSEAVVPEVVPAVETAVAAVESPARLPPTADSQKAAAPKGTGAQKTRYKGQEKSEPRRKASGLEGLSYREENPRTDLKVGHYKG